MATNSEGDSGWSESATVVIPPNRPPVINDATNLGSGAIYLFPHGAPGALKFDSEPVTDPDVDEITVTFDVVKPKLHGDRPDDHDWRFRNPSDVGARWQ